MRQDLETVDGTNMHEHLTSESAPPLAVLMSLLAACCPGREIEPRRPLAFQGLSSLAATRFLLQVELLLGIKLTIGQIADGLSLADIAEMISKSTAAPPEPAPPPPPSGRAGAGTDGAGIPLLPLQQSYLVTSLDGFVEDAVGCHIYREFEVLGFAAEEIAAAWERLCAVQPMLRARIAETGTYAFGPVPGMEILHATDDDYRRQIASRRSQWQCRAGRAPDALIKVAAVACRDRVTVILSADGLVIDGEGLAALLSQWSRLLQSPDSAPERPAMSYADCVARVTAAATPELQQYWETVLRDSPAPLFRAAVSCDGDAASAWSPGAKGRILPRRMVSHRLSDAQWQACEATARSLGISPTALVFSAFCHVLLSHQQRRSASVMVTTNARSRLPEHARDLVGSFTTCMLVPVDLSDEEDFAERSVRLSRELWRHLEYSGIGAVSALRSVGQGRATETISPVVFTSLLGGASSDRQGLFNEVHCDTQTSSVFLEHQIEPCGESVVLRWFVVDEKLPAFAADLCFARMVDVLVGLGRQRQPGTPLNSLQQAYWVQRRAAWPVPRCNAVFSAELPRLDLDLLRQVWTALMAATPALRSYVRADGTVSVLEPWSTDRGPALIEIADRDFDESRRLLDRHLGDQRFVPSLWPLQSCVALRDAKGRCSVHVCCDLLFLDGKSIHDIVCQLLAALTTTADGSVTAFRTPSPPAGPATTPQAEAAATYWSAKMADLPSGPAADAGDDSGQSWQRLETRLSGGRRFRERCRRSGMVPDILLAAALAWAWMPEIRGTFALPLIWWRPKDDGYRPGEASQMAWLTVTDGREDSEPGPGMVPTPAQFRSLVATTASTVENDLRQGGRDGLAVLSRRYRGASPGPKLPVVYTASVEWSDLPEETAGSVRWQTGSPGIAMDAVSLWVNDTLVLGLDVLPGRFEPGVVDRVFSRLSRVAETLLSDPVWLDAVLAEAPAAGMAKGVAAGEPFPLEPVHRAFERAADRAGHADALIWKHGRWSYSQLNRQANRIARHLRTLGIGDGSKVAIRMRRGPHMVAAVFGILKAGGAYVPVEPYQPPERAGRMTTIADADVVLTTTDTEPAAAVQGWTLVEVDRLPPDPQEATNPSPVNTVDSTAYIIFTSGSTGEPKGVEVTHRPLQNLLNWSRRLFGFGPSDRGLCVTSLGFDLSVFDILGLLGFGASLYLADDTEQRDPWVLLRVLVDHEITFWNSAPKTFEHMQDLFPKPGEKAAALRLAFLSGDFMSVKFPEAFRAAFPNARLVNLGGATEATVWSNYYEVGAVDPAWRSIPYGRPIDDARYYVLDGSLRPCAVDEEGDLYIAGGVLGKGYHNRPDLTRERFLADPFHGAGTERMYMTGDRALYRPDGVIMFRGRSDAQVKIRGVRIELEEIEHVLRSHASIADAAVAVETDPSGDSKLVAYVQDAAPLAAEEIIAFLRTRLPPNMVPYRVCRVKRLPVTENGKLDRKGLAAAVDDPAVAAASDPERQAAEQGLADEICALLHRLLGRDVDPAADLWQQGVTSFTMVQLSSALRASQGIAVQVEWLLEAPTVLGIAAAIAAQGQAVQQQPVTRVSPAAAQQPPLEPVRPPETKARVDVLDRSAKEAFLASGVNLRRDLDGEPRLPLPHRPVPPQWLQWRASRRQFADRPVAAGELGHLLGFLARQNDAQSGRFLYPSAGATYAVQVYAWVRDGSVADMAGGYYWFDPGAAALVRIGAAVDCDSTSQFMYNRPIFEGSAAAIFLVGELAAIAPLYGDHAARMLTLEAGYMGELLMLTQAGTCLGLCPIGTFKEDQVRRDLRLSTSHDILHSFLVGVVDREPLSASSDVDLFGALQAPPVPSGHPMPRADESEIRIVGHSFRYPGVHTADEFASLLHDGGCAASAVPERAWAARQDGLFGAFLDNVEAFDAAAFGIAPSEAGLIDPQARLLLELVFHCLEQAGHSARSLEQGGERTGVFVGHMWQDHRLAGHDSGTEEGRGIAAAGSELANRISQVFGLTGPSIAVDTACTSALSAIHLACMALRARDCDSAVVCAVNLLTHPSHLATLQVLGFTAQSLPRGLYDGANPGWMVGEGAGVILLRRRDAFQGEADHVYGIIEASHVVHAGARAGYGVPNKDTVIEGLRAVLQKAGLAPTDIDYVECAAAGAAMADAAEWEAIRTVFPSGVTIGSLKANLGHLEAASGMSQLTRVLLQYDRGEMLPSKMAPERSPLIGSTSGEPKVVDRAMPLDRSRPVHRSIVSAMGSTSGAAQIVVAHRPGAAPPARFDGSHPAVIVLSAATRPQLDHLARAYVAALRRFLPEDWASLCATTQMGRKAFPCRLSVQATDPVQALSALQSFCDGHILQGVIYAEIDPLQAGRPSIAEDWRAAVLDWLRGFDVDWQRFWPGMPRRCVLPNYPFERRSCPLGQAPAVAATSGAADDWLAQVCRAYGEAAGIDPRTINPDRPLRDYGMTSRLAVEMAARLGRDTATVSPTLAYEYRDLRAMAQALAAAGRPVRERAAPPPRSVLEHGKPVAVIGYSGRFPGCANVDELWTHLVAGDDLVTGMPSHRISGGAAQALMVGGFLDDVASFDPFLFGITPHVAARMDPQERLLLQQVWHALEDAGYPPSRLHTDLDRQVGVYVGCMHNEYPLLGIEASTPDRLVDLGGTPAGLANRISYHLDVIGPSVALDTMCSSSLTAMKLAMDDLRLGRIGLAVVAACNLSLHPNKFVQQKRLKMTSPTSRCRSFSAAADGFVPAEGVVVVVLRDLAAATGSGDAVHAVIRGAAVNHGGKSNGYTVPNPAAQADIIRAAQADGNVAPETISYVETHGTGTVIGDPIEAKGIIQALALDSRAPALSIGSIKSSLGHLEAAAGIAGLVKVMKQMEHKLLVPSLHAENLNPDIDWTRLTLVRSTLPWAPRDDGGRAVWRAGVSSFGAGGSNAHVIVEAPPAVSPVPAPSEGGPCLLVLSAATPFSLTENAKALAEWLRCHRDDARLADVCATLQLGREPLVERWATLVAGVDDAVAALSSFVQGGGSGLRGRADPSRRRIVDTNNLHEVAARWVEGGEADWRSLYRGPVRPARLPGYRFEQFRCGVDAIADGVSDVPEPVSVNDFVSQAILVERVWKPRHPAGGRQARPALSGHIAVHGETAQRDLLVTALARTLPGATVAPASPVDSVAPADWLVLMAGALGPDPDGWKSAYGLAVAHIRAAAGRSLGLIVVAGPSDEPAGATGMAGVAKISALLQTLAAEHPAVTFAWLDVGRHGVAAEEEAQSVAEKIAGCLGCGQVGDAACTSVGESVPVWQELQSAPTGWRPKPDGLYVITGGTRGLGAKLALELAAKGARRLALIGRRRSAETENLMAQLLTRGVDVRVLSGTVENGAAVEDWLTALAAEMGPVTGVFHCAGIGSRERAALKDKVVDDIAATLSPKVDGLLSFLGLLRRDRPEFLVAFSSISAVLPGLGTGVGDYAAGNLAMEYAAERLRRDHGLPVSTIAWPVWDGSTADEGARRMTQRHGLPVLADAQGFALLWHAIGTPSSGRLAVVTRDILAERLGRVVSNAHVETASEPAAGPGSAKVAERLREIIARLTGIPADRVRGDAHFSDLGIESVALANLVDALEADFALPFGPGLVLEHSCVDALASVLSALTTAQRQQDMDSVAKVPAEAAPDPSDDGIAAGADARKVAVIGLGLRFPGAGGVAEFRKLLADGRCAIIEVPGSRWDVEALYDPAGGAGKSLSKWGGFLDGLEEFDPEAFGLSDEVARNLDPAIRLILEVARACLRDAGLGSRDLPPATAVFIGARMGDYRLRARRDDGESGLGFDQNFIAAYLSHMLNIRGPNLVVDSACSSSLVAVHLACQSLLSGESECALAGGVDVLLDQSVYLQFSRAGALSRSGQCRSFDMSADGFVPGEGAGILLLKRLDQALRDGDPIHAVIEGSAVNNDGATMGLTTPNPDAHRDAILAALRQAGRPASAIGMVEAHGTATRIGDPIEFQAFTQAFRADTGETGFCALGSVKSNIGHLLSAAGIAGLAKAILAVEGNLIPATLFCRRPNPRFDLAGSPFYIPRQGQPWPDGQQRVAGVSACGLGGTNAHVIVAQAPGHTSARHRLPPDEMNRRRLWLGEEPAPHEPVQAVWSSLLDLGFSDPPNADLS